MTCDAQGGKLRGWKMVRLTTVNRIETSAQKSEANVIHGTFRGPDIIVCVGHQVERGMAGI